LIVKTKSQKKILPGYTGVFVTAAMWATSGIFIKLILNSSDISEFSLAFYRDLLTFLVFFVILLIFRRDLLRIVKRDVLWFAGLGGFGLGTLHLLWNFGVAINGVAVSTVQQAMMPIILAIAARFAFKELLNKYKIFAIIITFIGAIFLSGFLKQTNGELNVSGILVGFAIPLTYAMFNLFSKKITGRYHPFTILTYGFGFGALTLLPVQLFLLPQSVSPQLSSFLWLGGLIVISTVLPFLLYTFLLRDMEVSVAGILSMAEIPIAFFYAFIVFNEMFTLYQWIGTALIILGIRLFLRYKVQDEPGKDALMHD